MKIDFTVELAQLLAYAADTGAAIRMYSKYTNGTARNGMEFRDQDETPVDLMFLSDSLTQFAGIAVAISKMDIAEISEKCQYTESLFESYLTDNPKFSPQAKPTFDFWRGRVDLTAAITAFKLIRGKCELAR